MTKTRKRRSVLISLVVLETIVSLAGAGAQSRTEHQKSLTEVADIALPGPAVRFDYLSLDAQNGRLYISHMNADQLVVFDTAKRTVIANLDGFNHVHGVIAIPEINRVFASITGNHQVVALDTRDMKMVATGGPVSYPDGLAYAPLQKRIFVSDERGEVDAVFDAAALKLLARIPLGGGAGNTVYDAGSGHILVAVHGVNQLITIDTVTNKMIGKYPLPGIQDPHGIVIDSEDHVAFVAGEENHSLAVFDMNSMRVLSTYQVGEAPDVLAYDPGLKRLYVSAESGTVTIFHYGNRELTLDDTLYMPHAHSVAVDPRTHLVYFPLENIAGHPLLRIMRPGGQK